MNYEEVSVDKLVDIGLQKCDNLQDFCEFAKELVPLSNSRGIEFLKEFYKKREEFFNKLENSGFVITPDNVDVLRLVPDLYLISLKNDYKNTIKMPKESYFQLDSFPIGNEMITNKKIMEYSKIFIENKELTEEISKNSYFPIAFPKFISASKYIAQFSIDTNKVIENKYLFKNLSKEEQEFVYNVCYKNFDKNKCPQFIVESKAFLKDRFNNDYRSIKNIIMAISESQYTINNEKAFLKYIGSEYEDIETHYYNFFKKNKDIKGLKLSFEDKLMLAMWTKKIAYNEGIDKIKVITFDYNNVENTKSKGKSFGNEICLYVNNNFLNVKDLTVTALHEIQHLIQFKNIANFEYEKEKDVDIYTKDRFLRMWYFKKDYINDYNYARSSLEQDADFKAEIKATNLFNEDFFSSYLKDAQEELRINGDKINHDIKESNFELKRLLDGKITYLDDLVLKALNECKQKGNKKEFKDLGMDFESVQERFPFFKYDYDLQADPVKKRTLTQLFDKLCESKFQEDKDIYRYLIEQRLSKRKNKVGDVEKSAKELSTIIETLEAWGVGESAPENVENSNNKKRN